MRLEKRPAAAVAAILAMVTVVIMLAVLQYQWTGEISRGAEDRMREALASSTRQFRVDFARELNRICAAFQPDPAAPPNLAENAALSRYGDWASVARRRNLVSAVHIWRIDAQSPRLLSLDTETFRFRESAWPAHLAGLQEYLAEMCWELVWTTEREAYRHPWILYEPAAVLVQALFYVSPGEREPGSGAQHIGFILVELDRQRMQGEFLPSLVARHFGASQERNFLVAVRAAGKQGEVLYQSDPERPVSSSRTDADVALLDPEQDRWEEPVGGALRPSGEPGHWRLAVQHRAGSMEAAVSSLRRRNLAVSFSLLALLAGSMALILVLARRTQRLAALQMEFVAGVSHELRTPLSVICSASDNLAEGIVSTPERARQYGGLIRDEGRRLARMVEQALLFAAEQSDRMRYDLQPVQPVPVIERALKSVEAALKETGMQVEISLPGDLPAVLADANALGQCVENLVGNAVKYGRSGGWMGISASAVDGGARPEVQISVEDRGPGISHADLAHVFEPFYRARSAREGQIKGAGLGLYLVRRIMEAMGGRVTAWSRPGRGSRFTLCLPAAGVRPAQTAPAERTT